jgi:hypothetical protein
MANRNFDRNTQSLERYLTLVSGRVPLTAVTGAVGTVVGKGFTVAKGGANSGEYTFTLSSDLRFKDNMVLHAECSLTGAAINQQAKVESYDGSAGTIQIQVYVPTTGAAIADAAVVAGDLSFLLVVKNTEI